MEEIQQITEKKSKAWIWILILILIAAGIGAYFLFFKQYPLCIGSGCGSSIPQPPALPSG